MQNISQIVDKVRRGQRINSAEAAILWREAPLWLLGELAVERKRQASGVEVYYNRNVHIEPTNICLFNCEFCSFRRRESDSDAWYMSMDDIAARARELQGKDITEVHIVGGVHPSHTLSTYCSMISLIKSILPNVAIKAYTAVEILYMIRKEGVTVVEGLRRLKEAGMECIPGGGAEIFDETLRQKICPDKCSSEEWLAVHRAAHNMGISTNCTMLYGHVESIEQRVDHLDRLRRLQDEAPGFDAFIPLKYRSRNNRMSAAGECSVEEDLRTIAMSRIYLDNIPHIKAYWVAYGKATTEMALAFGADDIDGTIDDSTKIYSMAGADAKPTMSVAELEALVHDAGFVAVERDTHYRRVEREAEAEVVVPLVDDEQPAENSLEESPRSQIENNIQTERDMQTEKPRSSAAPRGGNAPSREMKRSVAERIKDLYSKFPVLCHIALMFIVGILLLLCLYLGLRWGTRHGDVIDVPNLIGMSEDDARRTLENLDLQIVIADSVFDADIPGGTVMDQLPRTSDVRTVTVKPDRKIYVTINAYNRRMMRVPNVEQLSLVQALNQLERSGFVVDKLVYEVDAISTDFVTRVKIGNRTIKPSSSVDMPYGTGVTLHVTYERDRQNTTVPRLFGMRYSQARRTLWNNGLNVTKVVYDQTAEDLLQRREAKVYKQSVSPNSGARRGSGVTLYMTCDGALIDSLAKISDAGAKQREEARLREQKALEERIMAEEEAAREAAMDSVAL